LKLVITALNERNLPQWNCTQGGRVLLRSALVPLTFESVTVSLYNLSVMSVIDFPVSVESKIAVNLNSTDWPLSKVNCGALLPGELFDFQSMDFENSKSLGLNINGIFVLVSDMR
jgi:hypothetical protein